MKEQVKIEDKKEFEKLSQIYAALLFAAMITPIPLIRFLKIPGIAIWCVLMAVTLYVAVLVEKKKKLFDIQTYKEIIAFTEGSTLDEISKAREEGKRPYQKVFLALGVAVITLIIAILFGLLLK